MSDLLKKRQCSDSTSGCIVTKEGCEGSFQTPGDTLYHYVVLHGT